VSLWIFLCAAALLSLERICYLWIWRAPGDFCALCARPANTRIGTPVDVLQFLFCGFKILQCAVFLAWCFVYGNGSLWPPGSDPLSLTLGAALLIGGQILNISVFYRLGKVGVFYGNKFGYPTRWVRKFPFSCLRHPQYVGALLSIWGFFLVMRFPQEDWYILPALETLYYALGAYWEQ
jgi:phosphatidyl-N-methylethanolamine N-methyltransferase